MLFANGLRIEAEQIDNEGLSFYLQRMKIEEAFKDLKSLLDGRRSHARFGIGLQHGVGVSLESRPALE